MNKPFEIEKILCAINFSQGREVAVWDKIASRISRDSDILTFREFENVGGGLSHMSEHCVNSDDLMKE